MPARIGSLIRKRSLFSRQIYLNRFLYTQTFLRQKSDAKSDTSIVPKTAKKQRPTGGGRPLFDKTRVFDFNNWDNIVWDEEQEKEAQKKVEINTKNLVNEEMQEKYETEANHFWDEFYTQHQNRFFKDRHWLFTEFPELASQPILKQNVPERVIPHSTGLHKEDTGSTVYDQLETKSDFTNGVCDSEPRKDWTETELAGDVRSDKNDNPVTDSFVGAHGSTRLFEVGCGVGNTMFPVLQTNNDPGLFVYCCDLSTTAITLVKEHPDYNVKRCHGFVCDVSDPDSEVPFPKESLDIIILIFVLSAIHPDKMQQTITRLATFLKPGGKIVFRDYGRYDMAQLRFKDGRCLSKNFYVRGDGTRVYFFTQEELKEMFTKAGLLEEQNLVDRRLQVNRGRQLKMYRVWIQCKYKKP